MIENSDALLKAHRRTVIRRWCIIAALTLLALLAFGESIIVGVMDIGWGEVFAALIDPTKMDSPSWKVLVELRTPMAVMAILVGMLLSLAGAQMQTILGNPLAEPFTLGVSAAGAFGGALAIVLHWEIIAQPQLNIALMAWVAALLTSLLIVGVAIIRGASAETMILLGIALTFLFQALLALIQYVSSAESLQQVIFWQLGSMTRASWSSNLIMTMVLLIAIPILSVLGWQLTALRLGDARAASMGVNVTRLRIGVLLLVSLMAATTVAFTGIIGFVGLIGPHVARMLVGEDQRFFLPASLAAGALMMSCSHAVSQLVRPGQVMPIAVVTAIIGVPFFLIITLTRRRSLW